MSHSTRVPGLILSVCYWLCGDSHVPLVCFISVVWFPLPVHNHTCKQNGYSLWFFPRCEWVYECVHGALRDEFPALCIPRIFSGSTVTLTRGYWGWMNRRMIALKEKWMVTSCWMTCESQTSSMFLLTTQHAPVQIHEHTAQVCGVTLSCASGASAEELGKHSSIFQYNIYWLSL